MEVYVYTEQKCRDREVQVANAHIWTLDFNAHINLVTSTMRTVMYWFI